MADFSLDKFDIGILNILQSDNSIPLKDIGEKVGLSGPAVQRRIKKLRENNIIVSDISVLNPDKVGQFITLFVEVELENEQIAVLEDLKDKFRSVREIQQCYYITGQADFMLVVVVPVMSAYEQLTKKLFFENPNIKRFRTSVVMDCVKGGLSLPLEPSKKILPIEHL